MLLYALGEGREVRADAGLDNRPFPEEQTRDTVLTWCAGLRPSRPPAVEGVSVEVRPSIRRSGSAGRPDLADASGAQFVVLVSCHEFGGAGPWMSSEEEREFMLGVEARGRGVAWLGAEVAEPWSI